MEPTTPSLRGTATRLPLACSPLLLLASPLLPLLLASPLLLLASPLLLLLLASPLLLLASPLLLLLLLACGCAPAAARPAS
jgi:hypothetical protein